MTEIEDWEFGLKANIENCKQVRKSNIFIVLAAMVLCAACSTTPQVDMEQPKISVDAMLKQAELELVSGKRDQALSTLNLAAKENPTSMTPWLKISNIWFNASNYPSSILAANEVIKRDPGNQEARSILVVAGLRVAAEAVRGLVLKNPANFSARYEAESMTKTLRTALGETVLVPPAAVAAPVVTHRRSRRSSRHAKPESSDESPAVAKESSAASSSASDPFKALK